MFVVVDYKGKQYKVEKGSVLSFDKLVAKEGSKVELDKVLLVRDGDKVIVGTPYVEGVKVVVSVQKTFRDKKTLVLKYKSKKDYHRLIGYRASYTNVKVDDILTA